MMLGLLRGPLSREAAGTFALRVFQAGLRFLISVILARLLGTEGYGAYAFAMAWLAVLSVPALLGFDGLLVREVASYKTRSQIGLLRGMLRRARQLTLLASLTLLLAAAGIAWVLSTEFARPMLITLWVGLLALPVLTEVRIIQAVLVGLRRIMAAQTPEAVAQPLFFIGLIGVIPLLRKESVDAEFAVGLYGVSVLAAWVLATGLLHRVRQSLTSPHAPEYRTVAWIRSALPFALTTGLNVLGASLGVLMLGPMRGPAETGVFGVVAAAAALVSLPLMAINTPLAPAVAAVFAQENNVELQRLATKAARSAFSLCLPVALIYILFGQHILRLFGDEFTTGYMSLVILSVGQMINVAMGSVGVLLQMTGHERNVAIALAVAVLVNFTVNLVSIPFWGAEGAALGAAANLIVWNTILLIQVRRKLAIRPTAIG